MQKKLIALAVAGVFAAPAFAATSNVDIYGVLTMSVDHVMTDSTAADDTLNNVSSYASRIGFKGSEDLGGGLAAIWQIEDELANDPNTNLGGAVSSSQRNFSKSLRNTYVGLKSDAFGTALIGIHDTPYKFSTASLDPFADTAGDYNQIMGNVDGANNFDLRASNVLAYVTPTFSGFSGAIAYVFGNELGNGTSANQSAWSMEGSYNNGPIFVTAAYEKHNNLSGSEDRAAWKVGGGYNFGNATLGLIYEKAGTILAQEEKRNAWYIPATYTMGNIVLKAAYGKAGDIDNTNNTGASFYDLGADYNLSKRTKLFAVYSKTNNDGNGEYGIAVAGTDAYYPNPGEDPSVFSIGIRHSF